MNILFPVLTIEWAYPLCNDGSLVETIGIDADAVRVRAWHVEGLDATVAAEIVLCHPGIERVSLDIILPANEPEIALRHNQMQEPGHAADAAVAVCNIDFFWCRDFKAYAAAVATSRVYRHCSLPSSFTQTAT